MYQTVYDTTILPKFNPAMMQPVIKELQAMSFSPDGLYSDRATFRDGERYVMFAIEADCLTTRVGVGSHDTDESKINSMRLDEMIGFLFGGLKRGCHSTNDAELSLCLSGAMKDLKEFAHEFLRGDFRPFLRVLAIKKREEREAEKSKKDLAEKIYLA